MLTEADIDEALLAALLDIERFVGQSGWDQPARLFALVRTDDFIAAQPDLAKELNLRGSSEGAPPGAMTSIEQDDFAVGEDLGEALSRMFWPASVHGCALVIERTFLPECAEKDVPDDPEAAARFVAAHPDHDELRMVCGVARADGAPREQAVARLRNADELLAAPDLLPGLTKALANTLASDEGDTHDDASH